MDPIRKRKSKLRKAIYNVFGRPCRKAIKIILRFTDIWTRILIFVDHYFNLYMGRVYPAIESRDLSGEKQLSKYFKSLKSLIGNLAYQPKISIILPVYKVAPKYLLEAIASVGMQVYQNWELCIVDDKSEDPRLIAMIEKFQKKYPGKIHLSINEQNSHISVSSNNALNFATGEYVTFLDHDDRLNPNALAEVVRYINLNDQPDVLYSDERKIDEEGFRLDATFFKPGWSPYFHLCVNYTTHLSVYKTALVKSLGGLRQGYEGAQDHDLMLRAVENTKKPIVHVPFSLYQWRAIAESTASSDEAKPYAATAGIKAVTEACVRRGQPAEVVWNPTTLRYKTNFAIKENPLVSIVIPTKNALKFIENCLNSIIEKTTYKNFEIIVIDNGSDEAEAIEFLKMMDLKHANITLLQDNRTFNFARMNNLGVQQAKGEYVVLLNNDTEVLTKSWLEEMLMYAQLDDVGVVGCKLLYPDESIQHGGLVGLGKNVAGHLFKNKERNNSDYFNYLQTAHEVFGATAGCLMVKKSKYEMVGGLEEQYLPNGYGDVELCINLANLGLRHMYTPHAELFHFESPSRGIIYENFERDLMNRKYGKELLNDPYLHPNFVRGEHFHLDSTVSTLEASNYLLTEMIAEETKGMGFENLGSVPK